MTAIDLTQLRALAEAATGGPWHWSGNTDSGEPYLATWLPGAGRCQVLSIGSEDRSAHGTGAESMRSYLRECGEYDDATIEEEVKRYVTDAFGNPVQEPRLQFMTDLMCVNARDLAVYEVAPSATSRDDPKVYRADVAGIRHPDAAYIVAAEPRVTIELLDRIDAVLKEHRPVRYVFSWRDGLRVEELCETCKGAPGEPGDHECGCWQPEQLDFRCFECSRPEPGDHRQRTRDVAWPCPTVQVLNPGAKL